jgi:hypothetical protein
MIKFKELKVKGKKVMVYHNRLYLLKDRINEFIVIVETPNGWFHDRIRITDEFWYTIDPNINIWEYMGNIAIAASKRERRKCT